MMGMDTNMLVRSIIQFEHGECFVIIYSVTFSWSNIPHEQLFVLLPKDQFMNVDNRMVVEPFIFKVETDSKENSNTETSTEKVAFILRMVAYCKEDLLTTLSVALEFTRFLIEVTWWAVTLMGI